MLDLNQQTLDQNNQIRGINRVAYEAIDTSNNILRELDDQKNKIHRQIGMV
jgi:hypothetical protein